MDYEPIGYESAANAGAWLVCGVAPHEDKRLAPSFLRWLAPVVGALAGLAFMLSILSGYGVIAW